MDGDGAAREAELKSLREKNEELRAKLREQSARACAGVGSNRHS